MVYADYLICYSGVNKEERARAGVGIAIYNKYKDQIEECRYTSERIIVATRDVSWKAEYYLYLCPRGL